ncbi:MAG: hypothetical protein K5853_04505 [Lachnospiraceae bacterium]|nr:hypothetical protein [Lachnospiraceae bacterium]
MAIQLQKGNFLHKGAYRNDRTVTFTFVTDRIDTVTILLYDTHTFKLKHRITVPDSFRIGRVYSVAITGLSWDDLCYLLKCGKEVCHDAYATAIIGRESWMDESRQKNGYQTFGGFSDFSYTFKNESPKIDAADMILYKLHMRGFTMNHGLQASYKGNYKGILERLDELSDLGVTSLEFLPIYEFEEIIYHSYQKNTGKTVKEIFEAPYKTNYWGYGKADYFAPKASYFGGKKESLHMMEMVDVIHEKGMEIIMEISFDDDVSEDFIEEVLSFWMTTYHIDGFHLLGAHIPMKRIADNPYFSDCKLFHDNIPREVLYDENDRKHLFVYNDDFCYPLRRLQHHMDGNIADFADQLRKQSEFFGFVNYAASNTGFCLYDVYCYGEKHNQSNGEDNTDGSNYNCSYNHGVEGPSKKKNINRVRLMNARTAITSALLSQSIPLIYAGDEINNTQEGNNNPYCQDNAWGWTTFAKRKSAQKFRAYVKALIDFRKEHTVLSCGSPMQMTDHLHLGMPDLSYHGKEPWIMGIGAEKKAIGILYNGDYARGKNKEDVMLMFNFYYGEETFAAPKLPGNRKWFYVTNTAEEEFSPADEPLKNQSQVIVPGGTVTILIGKECS